MAKREKPTPRLLVADSNGEIYDHPDLLMLVRRGRELALPRPDEIMPLPEGSEFFLLPGRRALGLDTETGEAELMSELAVAAFVCPAHTVTGIAAYTADFDAATLPLLSYAALGYAEGKFWVAARRVDEDKRQVFEGIAQEKINDGATALMRAYPENRLIRHLTACALTSGCPAAKNLALGRFEAPLPTAQTCNARCVGCISEQPEDSGFPSPQCRIKFTPTPKEICQVMTHHNSREKRAVYSFGQGCEGEPLTGFELLCEATRMFRAGGGKGTVNVNTNGSITRAMQPLADAGVNSIRVSLNAVRPEPYAAYYRPKSYEFADVRATIEAAKSAGLFVSLNYLYFPGISDTEEELEALIELVSSTKLDFIQLRNLNLDPQLYLKLMEPWSDGPSMGLTNFRKRLRKSCDWLKFGYFNPYLGEGRG